MILNVAPLPGGAQHKHGDDAHATGRDDRADENAESAWDRAAAVALHRDQGVADQAAGQAAEADGRERGDPGGWRGQRRQRFTLTGDRHSPECYEL